MAVRVIAKDISGNNVEKILVEPAELNQRIEEITPGLIVTINNQVEANFVNDSSILNQKLDAKVENAVKAMAEPFSSNVTYLLETVGEDEKTGLRASTVDLQGRVGELEENYTSINTSLGNPTNELRSDLAEETAWAVIGTLSQESSTHDSNIANLSSKLSKLSTDTGLEILKLSSNISSNTQKIGTNATDIETTKAEVRKIIIDGDQVNDGSGDTKLYKSLVTLTQELNALRVLDENTKTYSGRVPTLENAVSTLTLQVAGQEKLVIDHALSIAGLLEFKDNFESNVDDKIKAESSNRTDADAKLSSAISEEVTRAKEAESSNTTLIDNNKQAIEAEAARAQKAEKDINDKLDTLIGDDEGKSAKDIAETAAATKVAEIVAGADTNFDTLKEIADWIGSDTSGAAAMSASINSNANNIKSIQTDVTTLEEKVTGLADAVDSLDETLSGLETTADKILFKSDLIFTEAFGKYKPDSTGQVKIVTEKDDGTRMSLLELLMSAFATEDTELGKIILPSIKTFTINGFGEYEVGDTAELSYSITFDAGSYPYGTTEQKKTGITATEYSITINGKTATVTANTGNLDAITITDNTNIKASAYATYTNATQAPISNLGNTITDKKIVAGTTTVKTTSNSLTGYRNIFYGAFGGDIEKLNTTDIRALSKLGKGTKGSTFEIKPTYAEDGTYNKIFIIAIPSTSAHTIESVTSTTGMSVDMTTKWLSQSKIVPVAGADGKNNELDYTVYYWTATDVPENTVHKVVLS